MNTNMVWLAAFGALLALGADSEQTWQIRPSDQSGKVEFQVERRKVGHRSNWSSDVALSKFRGLQLSAQGPARFEYVTDAATLVCEGQIYNGRGNGTFTLRTNPQYAAELSKLGYGSPDESKIFNLAIADVSLEFARGVKSAGLNATLEELLEMRIHGLTLDYIAAMRASGYTALTPKNYVEMKIHGVSPDFVKELKAAGYDLPVRQIVELKIHGIDMNYVRDLRSFGLQPDARQLVEMKIHGVSPAFVKDVRELGYQCSTRQLVELKIHGVDGAYLRKLRDAGMKNLTPEQVVKLKIHGID